MLFQFSFNDKHLKKIKQRHDAFYKLVNKLIVFSEMSFEQLISLPKESGVAKINTKEVYKKLGIDEVTILYKFRVSDSIRCYCSRHTQFSQVLNLIYLDVNHEL